MPDLLEWLPVGMGLLFAAIGQVVAHAPTRRILQWDRRTGYWLYQRELKRSGDEEQALYVAGRFYKVFGWIFSIGALLFAAIALLAALWQ